MSRKVAGSYDWIFPVGVLGLGVYFLWKLGIIGNGSGGGGGLATAATTTINNLAASSPLPVTKATVATATALDAWYQTQYDVTNPFLNNLYHSNTACPSVSPTIAQDLWVGLYTASNATAFFKPTPDLSGILGQWQQYITNQCDVSFIADKCQTQEGTSLWEFMNKYFTNDATGTSGQTNVTMFYNLVQWVTGLPSGLPQD